MTHRLRSLPLEALAAALSRKAAEIRSPSLPRAAFVDVLVAATGGAESRSDIEAVAKSIFDMLIEGAASSLEIPEAVAGLSMHCVADHESAARAVFAAFDTDRSGGLDEGELARMLHSSIRLVQNEKAAALSDAQKRQIAAAMAARTFVRVDTDGDGTIDAAEFRVFFLQTRGISTASPPPRRRATPRKRNSAGRGRSRSRAGSTELKTPEQQQRRARLQRRGSAGAQAARLTMEKARARRVVATMPTQQQRAQTVARKPRVGKALRAAGHGLRDALRPASAPSRRMLREGGWFLTRSGGSNFLTARRFVWMTKRNGARSASAASSSSSQPTLCVGDFKGDAQARRVPLRSIVEVSRFAPPSLATRHRATYIALGLVAAEEDVVLAACDTNSEGADAWAEAFALLCKASGNPVRLRRRGEFVNPLAALSSSSSSASSSSEQGPRGGGGGTPLPTWTPKPVAQRRASAWQQLRTARARKEKIRSLSRILTKRRRRNVRKGAVKSALLTPQTFVARLSAEAQWSAHDVWIERKEEQIILHAKRLAAPRGRTCFDLAAIAEISRKPLFITQKEAAEKGTRCITLLGHDGALRIQFAVPQCTNAAAIAQRNFAELAKLLQAVHAGSAAGCRVTPLEDVANPLVAAAAAAAAAKATATAAAAPPRASPRRRSPGRRRPSPARASAARPKTKAPTAPRTREAIARQILRDRRRAAKQVHAPLNGARHTASPTRIVDAAAGAKQLLRKQAVQRVVATHRARQRAKKARALAAKPATASLSKAAEEAKSGPSRARNAARAKAPADRERIARVAMKAKATARLRFAATKRARAAQERTALATAARKPRRQQQRRSTVQRVVAMRRHLAKQRKQSGRRGSPGAKASPSPVTSAKRAPAAKRASSSSAKRRAKKSSPTQASPTTTTATARRRAGSGSGGRRRSKRSASALRQSPASARAAAVAAPATASPSSFVALYTSAQREMQGGAPPATTTSPSPAKSTPKKLVIG